jgi:hypothetical protein
MANGIQFQTGFDHYTTLNQRWNSVSADTGNWIATIQPSVGRNSTSAFRIQAGAAPSGQIRKTLPTALSTIYHAFAFKSSDTPAAGNPVIIAELLDVGTTQVDLRYQADGTLAVTRNGTVLGVTSGLSALLLNVFYHIEWKVVINNSGSIAVRINEVEVLNVTGIDTQNTANSTASQVANGLTGGLVTGGFFFFDDVAVRDDTWNGDVQVKAFFPIGTGFTNQWTPVNAATTREAVDETAPNSDTDYATASTVSFLSLWTYNTIPVTSTITAVIPLPFLKKTDAGTAKAKSVIRLSSTNYSGTEVAPSDSAYEYQPDINMTSPATGITWTVAEWNAPIEIGVTRTA